MAQEEPWSEEAKLAFKRHISDINYYLSDLNQNDFNCNFNEINVLLEGGKLQAEIRIRRQNGADIEADDDFCEFIINSGHMLMFAYSCQHKQNYPAEIDKFHREHEVIIILFDLIVDIRKSVNERHQNQDGGSRRREGSRWQDHPINQLRETNGFYPNIVVELKKYPEKFKNYTRMSEKQFNYLVELVGPKIQKCDLFRAIIPPELRILITLRHLATGEEHGSIALDYLIGKSTAQQLIPETCKAIWDVLQPIYIQWPDDLESVSEKFNDLHKLPHCIGAVDGKHIRIQKPPNSGGKYVNYKKFHSIVLMAVCDAETNFIYAHIGGYGSQSDGSVWSYSSLGRAIRSNDISWPENKNLPGSQTPFHYFLIGDEAFPLEKHFFRPYGGRNLPDDKRYFNDRLTTARNTIERTFGILANRFRIFRTEIIGNVQNVINIVKASITLHNFIHMTGDSDTPEISTAFPNISTFTDLSGARGRPTSEGNNARALYKDYLNQ